MPKGFSARSASLTSQESTYSAVIIADMVAEVQQSSESNEANGISKGVILNALQFGQNENKSAKPPIEVQRIEKPKNFKEEFHQMSSLRKMAFGFSFLPSIMFVLCFSVIFPCEKILPCVNVLWSKNLNDTEITSNLLEPMNVLFAFSNNGGSGVKSLSKSSGDILWEKELQSSSEFLECEKFVQANKLSCLVTESKGIMHMFDPSNGRKIWELKLNTSVLSMVILPDCNNDGLDEIAVATSNSQIRILSIRNIPIEGCVPFNLIAWKKQNGTDLVFLCKNGENEILMNVAQEVWCRKNQEVKISTLTTKKAGILSQSKLLPMTDGLLLWSDDLVTMFKVDGHQLWSVPSSNHSTKNRFLLNGKYRQDKTEIFLYSSEISTNLQITRLTAENGKTIQTKTIPHLELTDIVSINGEEYDFILGFKKKVSESLRSKTISQINEVSSTVLSVLTNKEVAPVSTPTRINQEITLMEMDGKDLETIYSEELAANESNTSSFTAVLKENFVQLYVTRASKNSTWMQSITVSNWDKSSEKTSHCV